MPRTFLALSCFVLLSMPVAVGFSQTGARPAATRVISLKDALVLCLAQNPGLLIQNEELLQAKLRKRAAYGKYEPTVQASYRHSSATTPPETSDEGVAGERYKNTSDSWGVGISQPIPTGGTVSIDSNTSRYKSMRNNALLPSFFSGDLVFSLAQPLLRGFSLDLDIPRAELISAQFASSRAQAEHELALQQTLVETSNAYWDLVLATKQVGVQQDSLRVAQEQLALSKKQVDAGILPPSDALTSEASVARLQLSLVSSMKNIEQASDRLRQLLGLSLEGTPEELVPSDLPDAKTISVSEATAIAEALRNRPEVAIANLARQENQLSQRLAHNQSLPQIDAQLSYSVAGQAAKFGQTWDEITERNAPAWTAMLSLVWTPLGLSSRALAKSADSAARVSAIAEEQRITQIRGDVRQAVRDLEAATQAIPLAKRSRELAEADVDAEQRKFLAGNTTNYDVSKKQEELVRARYEELSAVIAHEKALTAYYAAIGSLYDHLKITMRVAK